MLVYIEGRIQTRQWEDKRDGQKRDHRNRGERDAHAPIAGKALRQLAPELALGP